MEELWGDFEKIQEEFHEVIENYPIFEEDIEKIFDKDIHEVEELIEKNDEYYLKKAIRKLEDLIEYIKDTSDNINKLYKEYDKLTDIWNKLEIKKEISQRNLDRINEQVKRSNELIIAKNYEDVKEAVNLFSKTIKELKEYEK